MISHSWSHRKFKMKCNIPDRWKWRWLERRERLPMRGKLAGPAILAGLAGLVLAVNSFKKQYVIFKQERNCWPCCWPHDLVHRLRWFRSDPGTQWRRLDRYVGRYACRSGLWIHKSCAHGEVFLGREYSRKTLELSWLRSPSFVLLRLIWRIPSANEGLT